MHLKDIYGSPFDETGVAPNPIEDNITEERSDFFSPKCLSLRRRLVEGEAWLCIDLNCSSAGI